MAKISEWVMAAAFDVFILTLATDLRGLTLQRHCDKKQGAERRTLSSWMHVQA